MKIEVHESGWACCLIARQSDFLFSPCCCLREFGKLQVISKHKNASAPKHMKTIVACKFFFLQDGSEFLPHFFCHFL